MYEGALRRLLHNIEWRVESSYDSIATNEIFTTVDIDATNGFHQGWEILRDVFAEHPKMSPEYVPISEHITSVTEIKHSV